MGKSKKSPEAFLIIFKINPYFRVIIYCYEEIYLLNF